MIFQTVSEVDFSKVRTRCLRVASLAALANPSGKRVRKWEERSMPTEENKAIIRRGFEEILNQRNLDAVDTYFSPNYVGHDPALPEDLHGREEFRQFAASYLSAFPDLHITIEDQFVEGDKVVTRFTSRGTHQGDFVGIPPTGNRITVEGISIDRMVGGKSEESWTINDIMGMMQQLGAIPAPPGQSEEAPPPSRPG